MASFKILAGKTLKTAIDKFSGQVASFTELQHQLAYSTINHVEEHSCASHLNRLYAATPTNYRAALKAWAVNFGKVAFIAEPEEAGVYFAFDAKSKSDLPGAMEISPAEYQRDKAASSKVSTFDEVKAFETLLAKLNDKGGSPKAVALVEGAIRALKNVDAAPIAANVRKPRAVPAVTVETTPAIQIAPPVAVEPVAIAA